jgi:hypothetical protein
MKVYIVVENMLGDPGYYIVMVFDSREKAEVHLAGLYYKEDCSILELPVH